MENSVSSGERRYANMMSRICFAFVAFYFAAVLILSVSVRSANNRIFYKLCSVNAGQERLKQELGNKQLQLENLINPAAVSERLAY